MKTSTQFFLVLSCIPLLNAVYVHTNTEAVDSSQTTTQDEVAPTREPTLPTFMELDVSNAVPLTLLLPPPTPSSPAPPPPPPPAPPPPPPPPSLPLTPFGSYDRSGFKKRVTLEEINDLKTLEECQELMRNALPRAHSLIVGDSTMPEVKRTTPTSPRKDVPYLEELHESIRKRRSARQSSDGDANLRVDDTKTGESVNGEPSSPTNQNPDTIVGPDGTPQGQSNVNRSGGMQAAAKFGVMLKKPKRNRGTRLSSEDADAVVSSEFLLDHDEFRKRFKATMQKLGLTEADYKDVIAFKRPLKFSIAYQSEAEKVLAQLEAAVEANRRSVSTPTAPTAAGELVPQDNEAGLTFSVDTQDNQAQQKSILTQCVAEEPGPSAVMPCHCKASDIQKDITTIGDYITSKKSPDVCSSLGVLVSDALSQKGSRANKNLFTNLSPKCRKKATRFYRMSKLCEGRRKLKFSILPFWRTTAERKSCNLVSDLRAKGLVNSIIDAPKESLVSQDNLLEVTAETIKKT